MKPDLRGASHNGKGPSHRRKLRFPFAPLRRWAQRMERGVGEGDTLRKGKGPSPPAPLRRWAQRMERGVGEGDILGVRRKTPRGKCGGNGRWRG